MLALLPVQTRARRSFDVSLPAVSGVAATAANISRKLSPAVPQRCKQPNNQRRDEQGTG